MKVNVVNVATPWRANPQMDYLYTINIEGKGEVKTFDAGLAELGEHEAEEYQSKSGKTFWRLVKQRSFKSEKQFKADPDSRESIEWQTSLKAAVEVTRDYYMGREPVKSFEDYCKKVDEAAVHFKNLINLKPRATIRDEEPDIDSYEKDEDNTPPTELYEDLGDES